MSRRLLVTGATGFVGATLVRLAVEGGDEVLVLLRPDDSDERLGTLASRVRIVRAALANVAPALPQIRDFAPQASVHLAWLTTPGSYLESRVNLDWLDWSQRLFATLLDAGCSRLIGVGSCAEYQSSNEALRVDSPLESSTLYAACKAAARLVGRELSRQNSASFAWARLFHLFGPGEHPERLVPAAARTLLQGETFSTAADDRIRDYLHVEDAARALLTLAAAPASGDFNVCSGQGVTLRRVVEEVARAVGVDGRLRFESRASAGWDPPTILGDPRETLALGWRPRFSLAQGIASAVEYWRAREENHETHYR
jgi:nucleoside-diphosphate-sugar epimerase